MNHTLFRRLGCASALFLGLGLVSPAAGISSPGVASAASAPADATDGRLVFNDYATGQLYTSNPDGSALFQVTHLRNTAAHSPQWSPDSTRIAYDAFSPRGSRIYEINADGTGRHLITAEPPGYSDFTPAYTPDGQRIVYPRCKPDPPGGCAIYSVAIDGTDQRPITSYERGDRTSFEFQTDVSPDGQWVSFNRFGWRGYFLQTWVVRIDGTEAHPVTRPRLVGGNSSWSPDGHLLYVQGGHPSGLGLHIFAVPAGGGGATQITFTAFPNGDFNPGPSPSGERVAFISDRQHSDLCCQDLFVMNADGSGQQFVDTGLALPGNPDWGSAPLQSGPSVRVPPMTRGELRTGSQRVQDYQHTWTGNYGKVGEAWWQQMR